MSSVCDDLASKLEWYDIRDMLLGQKQDVKRALALASACRYPDAQWLSGIFAGKDVKTWEEATAREVFLAQGDDDARALCFAAFLPKGYDEPLGRRSAGMGYAFAQAKLADHLLTNADENDLAFHFASLAAAQGERGGFSILGFCLKHGYGCKRNVEEAKKMLLVASAMNHSFSMEEYGEMLDESDPQRWRWWGLAAKLYFPFSFLGLFAKQISRFESDPSLAPVVFMIGRYLRGQVDLEKKEIFGKSANFDARVGPANRAIDFFTAQCAAARKAVDTWCLIARRIAGESVNRDIRKKIGMLIWEARELGGYVIGAANVEARTQE